MSTAILIPNGILCLADVDFKCPSCEYPYSEDFSDRMNKSKYGNIYIKCKGCRKKLGVTSDMAGKMQVWLKSEENNYPTSVIKNLP